MKTLENLKGSISHHHSWCGRSISTSNTLHNLQKLGHHSQRVRKTAVKIHAHSMHYAHKLTTSRRAHLCIWIWVGKHCAMWHVSGYIPIRCVSRQEAGNIMMVPQVPSWSQAVISVVSNSRPKTRSFPVSLHANMFFEASVCRPVSWFTTGTQNYCQSDWSILFLPSLFWGL